MTDGYSLSELLALPVWVFDMDGVVVDSTPLHARAFREIFDEIGIRMGDYGEIAGKPTSDAIADILKWNGKPVTSEIVEVLTQKKQERALELMSNGSSLVCTSGAVEFLRLGKNSAKLMCLVTSASGDRTGRALDLLDLDQFFSHIITSDDVAIGKPDPAPYLALLSLTGIRNPQSYLVFEDSVNGIDAALVAGMRVIHYAFDSGKQSKAHAVVRSFDDLIRALKTWKIETGILDEVDRNHTPFVMNANNSNSEETLIPEGLVRPVVAIVPAAGKGSRLDFAGPKVLFPVNGVPVLN